MKKTLYQAPETKVRTVSLCSAILTGSDYGDPGKAGSTLDVLDELSF